MKIKINKFNFSNRYKKRIILISDIHYYHSKNIKILDEVLENIKKLNPDYICIAGDIIDDKCIKNKELLINWFKRLGNVCKIFVGIGNHDFNYKGKITEEYDEELFKRIDSIKNVHVLNNKTYTDSKINFIGVTAPFSYYDLKEDSDELIYHINKKFKYLDDNFNIMIFHSPSRIADKKVLEKIKCHKNIDLILCGHMHGGLNFNFMNKFLKGRGLITPTNKIFGKYCNGLYRVNDTRIVISTGITKLAKSHYIPFMNCLYDSEIVVIDI